MKIPSRSQIPPHIWQSFWENSIPLKEAYWRFCDQETRARFQKLYSVSGPQVFTRNFVEYTRDENKLREIFNSAGEDPGARASAFLSALTPDRQSEFKAEEERLQRQCRAWVRDRQLIATGFNKGRKGEDLAIPLPGDASERGQFVWYSNKVYTASLSMLDVRLGHISRLNRLIEDAGLSIEQDAEPPIGGASSGGEIDTPITGRPSKKPLIWEAYEACKSDGRIDFSGSKSYAGKIVVGWIREYRPDQFEDGKGLGDETVRQVIGADFDETRKIRNS